MSRWRPGNVSGAGLEGLLFSLLLASRSPSPDLTDPSALLPVVSPLQANDKLHDLCGRGGSASDPDNLLAGRHLSPGKSRFSFWLRSPPEAGAVGMESGVPRTPYKQAVVSGRFRRLSIQSFLVTHALMSAEQARCLRQSPDKRLGNCRKAGEAQLEGGWP